MPHCSAPGQHWGAPRASCRSSGHREQPASGLGGGLSHTITGPLRAAGSRSRLPGEGWSPGTMLALPSCVSRTCQADLPHAGQLPWTCPVSPGSEGPWWPETAPLPDAPASPACHGAPFSAKCLALQGTPQSPFPGIPLSSPPVDPGGSVCLKAQTPRCWGA